MLPRRLLDMMLATIVLLPSACMLSTEGLSPEGAGGASSTTTSTTTSTGGSGGASTGTGSPGCPTGFECVPVLAGSYARPIADGGSCPQGWTATIYSDGTDPGCSACNCEAALGGSCTPGKVIRRGNSACGSYYGDHTGLSDQQCVDVIAGASGYFVEQPLIAQGSCQPQITTPTPVGTKTFCVFEPSGAASCGMGMTCVPTWTLAAADLCAAVAGSASACPSGLSSMGDAFAKWDDTRQCDCQCGPAAGAQCQNAGVTLHSDNSCNSAAITTIPADASCHDTSAINNSDSYRVHAGTWVGGSCAPIDNSTGAVSFSDPVTICCPAPP